jgi:excisionase family DNA binding protein
MERRNEIEKLQEDIEKADESERRTMKRPEAASAIVQASGPAAIPVWPKGALTAKEAADYLSISRTTLWRLTATGKIRRTSYRTYPKTELDRHLKEELMSQALVVARDRASGFLVFPVWHENRQVTSLDRRTDRAETRSDRH